MQKMIKTLLGATVLFSACATAGADDAGHMADVEGTYAGTFWCNFGEMGMTLSIKDEGLSEDKDMAEAKFHNVSGVLNFFPTLVNPGQPTGAFKISGWVHASGKFVKEYEFQPGEWIVQPENFGASPMEGRIVNGTIYGKPTVDGCHKLHMVKLTE